MHTDALLSTTGIIITDKQRCGKLSAAVTQCCCRPLLGPISSVCIIPAYSEAQSQLSLYHPAGLQTQTNP
ncbi:Hypothetical predicted protein, partial [Scomber scombrus]